MLGAGWVGGHCATRTAVDGWAVGQGCGGERRAAVGCRWREGTRRARGERLRRRDDTVKQIRGSAPAVQIVLTRARLKGHNDPARRTSGAALVTSTGPG